MRKTSNAKSPRHTRTTRLEKTLLARLDRVAELLHRSPNNCIELALMQFLDAEEARLGLPPIEQDPIRQ